MAGDGDFIARRSRDLDWRIAAHKSGHCTAVCLWPLLAVLTAKELFWIMPFQVRMFWDRYDPHPAFADREKAISYAKGLLAQLPDDAHPETEVSVLDPAGAIVFNYTLIAWRWAVMVVEDKAYTSQT
jgi:hypothetical protein